MTGSGALFSILMKTKMGAIRSTYITNAMGSVHWNSFPPHSKMRTKSIRSAARTTIPL